MEDNKPIVLHIIVNGRSIPTENIRVGPGNIIVIDEDNREYGYVPNYPRPIDTNPFNLIEGNENKLY